MLNLTQILISYMILLGTIKNPYQLSHLSTLAMSLFISQTGPFPSPFPFLPYKFDEL